MTLVEQIEMHRREKPSMSTSPLTPEERYDVALSIPFNSAFLEQFVDTSYLIDYAAAAQKITAGLHHLDESLPGGQKLRSEFAFKAMQQGIAELQAWMHARGYEV